ncbi:MAG: SDR family NAD(P)-dependent oxidoreductase [Steroidobacteraceae bacterium]
MRLKNKTAFITGATSGIGRVTARIFAQEGAEVVLAGRRKNEGEAVAEEIRQAGGRALFIQLDVTQPDQVEAAIAQGVRRFGKLDVIFNNAGGSSVNDGKVTDIEIQEFWNAIQLNLFGTFLCCRFGIPELIKAGGGSVINNGSYVALHGLGLDAYTASKGGVLAMTRSMAVEFAEKKIRVNAIAPAVVGTERIVERVKVDPLGTKAFAIQRLGLIPPEEAAYAALFFASDESRTTTGQTLYLNGGG